MAKRRAKGEGSVFLDSSGFWNAQITYPDGSRKRKRSKEQQVVKDWLLEQRLAVRDNRIAVDENMTFAQFSQRFLKDVAAHTVKPKTYDTYRWLIEKHISPEIGHLRLAHLQGHHLQSLYSAKIESGLSAKTVRHIHALIRRILNEAVKWGMINRNPCEMVTPPSPETRTPETFSREEVVQFLEAATGHPYFPIYVLAVGVGLRRSEILGLHIEDVDLDKGSANIRHTVIEIRGRPVVSTPKTKSSRRTVTLPAYVVEVLRQHLEDTDRTDGLLFVTGTGTPVAPRNLLRHYYTVLDKCDVPRIRFHDLRHTAATLLLQENVHPKVVQDLLGHSTITTTLDTYSHVGKTLQKEAADIMDDILVPGVA